MDAGSIDIVPRYLIFIALLLLGGAYFAAAETAFASVSRIRMISDSDDGDKRADKVLFVLDNFDKALTTILIGNNVMHIACSSAATLFASKLWGNNAVTATTFVTAFTVFFFAEMIPKSYAKACCETLAPKLAGSLVFLMKLLTPVSIVFYSFSTGLSRLMGDDSEEEPTVSEEELFDLIESIDGEDKIDEDAAELVQSALDFTVKTAKDILIPWDKVVTVNRREKDSVLLQLIEDGHYSRIPVVNDDGSIEGVLHIRKFLRAKIQGKKFIKQKSNLGYVHYVSPDSPIDELLDDLSSHKVHMAFVKNSDGSVAGIVTVEDILEELVGEIYDEDEKAGAL